VLSPSSLLLAFVAAAIVRVVFCLGNFLDCDFVFPSCHIAAELRGGLAESRFSSPRL
jgi:hypothetical protein